MNIIERGIRFIVNPYPRIRDRVIRRWATRYIESLDLERGRAEELPPIPVDLALIHSMIRKIRPKCILEFGVGFSTIVISDAVSRNNMGEHWCVDASEEWINNTKAKFDESRVNFHISPVSVLEIGGQLCHRYDNLPNIQPDFIYLDAPSPRNVQGEICGLRFSEGRPPVSADILLYESILTSDCIVVVDGRYANVSFLEGNFKRKWRIKRDKRFKRTVMTLVE